jgi:hypothetical protein
MADQELIDSIAPNETLGIKKKPSIFKILSVVGILTVVAITSYSLFMKTKQDEAIPPLSLGESVTPIAVAGQVQEPVVTDTSANPNATSVAESIPSGLTPDQTVVGSVPTPVESIPNTPAVTTAQLQPQLPAPVQAVTPTAQPLQPSQPAQANPLIGSVASQPIQQYATPAPAVAPVSPIVTSNEQVVEKAPIRKPKVAQTKKQVKKVVVAKETQQAYADEYTPKAPVIEEGVTHEEIIIFQ